MKIPALGLGTWDLRGHECTKIVQLALALGYHHIDTAHNYENHEAIRKGMEGFDRHQLFITSKFKIEQLGPQDIAGSVEETCDNALEQLGTDYLDLYLIHWPRRTWPLTEIFKAMEILVQKGKIRHAGVSNFTIHHLRDLLDDGCKPAANQVEFHPYLYQKQLWDYCQAQHIQTIAYRPFGKGSLLHDPLLRKIGDHHKKTPAQIILRWLFQKEIPTIPKASSEKHLEENINIFDFGLTEEEMKHIDHLNQNKRFCGAEDPEFDY
ncbi:MAG: aldo/keto reductase [Verrucomicrobia bacterium]|nr:aldo/keto reductase [Verrucomicrobiota bacterium]